MSKENVQKFYDFLQQDAAAAEELNKAGKDIDSAAEAMALLIAFAKSKGFEFTAEDIAAFEEDGQNELSLNELDQINAAGFTVCFGAGIGWGDTKGAGWGSCKIIGSGAGVGWEDASNAPSEKNPAKTGKSPDPLFVPGRFED